MLYDPKWEQQTKADPFTLESLIAWLEKQPSTEKYDFFDVEGCIACQYLQGSGFPEPWGGTDPGKSYKDIFGGGEAYRDIAGTWPWTFGAALERARALNK